MTELKILTEVGICQPLFCWGYILQEYDFQVLKLTKDFYSDYPNPPYYEMEMKETRRYNCLLIQSHYGYFICVPFRSRVKHKYCYHFKKSVRSRKGQSALDYSKCAIINDLKYLDNNQGIIDNDEYTEMMQNINKIVSEVLSYVDDYVSFVNNESERISVQEFKRRYQFSTLQYFHEILGIK